MSARADLVDMICDHDPNNLRSVALEEAARKQLAAKGPDWLTDGQLQDMAARAAADWRFTERLNEGNRARWRAKRTTP